MKAQEDEIGLRAETVITDDEVIAAAKEGKLKGWSFNMKHVKDVIEERADQLPLRHVTDFDMDEITLVLNKVPVYSATSIEVRADEEEDVEIRTLCMDTQYTESVPEKKMDYSKYENRIRDLEK